MIEIIDKIIYLRPVSQRKYTNGQFIRIKEIHAGAPIIRVTFNVVYSVDQFVNDNSCNKKGP